MFSKMIVSQKQKKKIEEAAFRESLANGSQPKLVAGMANAGTGWVPYLATTAPTSYRGINAPASYSFGNIGKGANVIIGSTSIVKSNNESSSKTTSIVQVPALGKREVGGPDEPENTNSKKCKFQLLPVK